MGRFALFMAHFALFIAVRLVYQKAKSLKGEKRSRRWTPPPFFDRYTVLSKGLTSWNT